MTSLIGFQVAFVDVGGFAPYNDFWAVTEFLSTAIFTVDIILKFILAYNDHDSKALVTDIKDITIHYLR